MLEDGKLYRPARRRLQPDSMHRNYLQREPFMYGALLSDCLPRKRHTVYRERPLQESLVSSLVNRKRPPLPRERPISRSMVADFLHRRREREKRPEESYHPQDVFGSKGSSLNRRCKSAPGRERREREACNRPSTGVSVREEFSIIRALIDEVLPKEKEKKASRNGTTTTKQQRWQESQSAVAKLVKSKLETKAVKVRDNYDEKDGGIASPPRSWPVRPASAPFKLSPQNMSPDDLAETLATKKRSFLRKRPATAPPPRPMFHLPLSRINNPRRSSTPKPAAAVAGDGGNNRKASVGSGSSSLSKKDAGVKAKALPSSSSLKSWESESRAAVTTASSSKRSGEKKNGRKLGSPGGRRKAAIETICSDSDDDDGESKSSQSSSSSSTSSSTLSSDTESEASSSTLSSFIELPTPSTLDSIDEWLRKQH